MSIRHEDIGSILKSFTVQRLGRAPEALRLEADLRPMKMNDDGELVVTVDGETITIDDVDIVAAIDLLRALLASLTIDTDDVIVSNFPTEYPLPTAQVTTLTPLPHPTEFPLPAAQVSTLTPLEAVKITDGVSELAINPTDKSIKTNRNSANQSAYELVTTAADTEYFFDVPANVFAIELQAMELEDFRISDATGKVAAGTEGCWFVWGGMNYYSDNWEDSGSAYRFYYASSVAGLRIYLRTFVRS